MDWQKIGKKVDNFLQKHPKVLNFLEKHGSNLIVLVLFVILGVSVGVCFKDLLAHNAEVQKQAIEKQISQLGSFTIKIVDEKGEPKLLYKDKTVEVREGVLYVCPLKTLNCANNSKAIIVGGNFIVEQQN